MVQFWTSGGVSQNIVWESESVEAPPHRITHDGVGQRGHGGYSNRYILLEAVGWVTRGPSSPLCQTRHPFDSRKIAGHLWSPPQPPLQSAGAILTDLPMPWRCPSSGSLLTPASAPDWLVDRKWTKPDFREKVQPSPPLPAPPRPLPGIPTLRICLLGMLPVYPVIATSTTAPDGAFL